MGHFYSFQQNPEFLRENLHSQPPCPGIPVRRAQGPTMCVAADAQSLGEEIQRALEPQVAAGEIQSSGSPPADHLPSLRLPFHRFPFRGAPCSRHLWKPVEGPGSKELLHF